MIIKKAASFSPLKKYTCSYLVFLFSFFIILNGYGQDVSADKVEASSQIQSEEDADDGPSLKNITKTNTAVKERLEAEARRRQILDIVYMVVGFGIVLTGAWYLATWARKQELKKEEAKRIRVEKALLKKGYTVFKTSDDNKPEETKSTEMKPPANKPPIIRRTPPPKRKR